MQYRFGQVLMRGACVLTGFVLIAGVIPGCGEEMTPEQAAGGPPPSVQESNREMENFMKSQGGKSKSKPKQEDASAKEKAPAKE